MGGAEENSVIQTQQGRHTGELTEAATRGTAPAQAQTRQNPRTEKVEWTQGLTPNQEVICNGYLLGKGCAKGSCVQQVLEEAIHLLRAAASAPDSLSPSSGVPDSPEGPRPSRGCLQSAVCSLRDLHDSSLPQGSYGPFCGQCHPSS